VIPDASSALAAGGSLDAALAPAANDVAPRPRRVRFLMLTDGAPALWIAQPDGTHVGAVATPVAMGDLGPLGGDEGCP
jgi:hypothetical protein